MKEILNYALDQERVISMRKEYGSNSLQSYEQESIFKKILGNLNEPIMRILIFILALNCFLVYLGKVSIIDTAGIAVAILLVTGISTYSEWKNNKKFNALQEEASRIICKVYRKKEDKIVDINNISINDIVKNDLVLLQAGDMIPADGIIVDGSISVQQSALNGEFDEVNKTVGEDTYETKFLNTSSVFRGSLVMSGEAIMKVCVVGDETILGGINKNLQTTEERETPLQVKLKQLAGYISLFGYIGGAVIALVFMFKAIVLDNGFDINAMLTLIGDWTSLFNIIVSSVLLGTIIIIMAVPEGLPLMVSIVNALNMKKMLNANVLVKKQDGIETAGSLNILFTDKTGTLTTGNLSVNRYIGDLNDDGLKKYMKLMGIVNNDAQYNYDKNEVIGGNATDKAVLLDTIKNFNDVDISEFELVEKQPFSSDNKYASAVVQIKVKDQPLGYMTLIKGMPEKIFTKCKYNFENGQVSEFKEDKKKPVQYEMDIESSKCNRMIAYAVSFSDKPILKLEDIEELYFLSIVVISDTIRQEAITAIGECHNAGVQVVMITGDKLETAKAIAKEMGIINSNYKICLTHDDIAQKSDDELKKIIPNLAVVARALPEDKLRLVKISQSLNLVVGMGGDGVNDSPALKQADVGFAMGNGTEVAKEASKIVILDSNFYSIRNAILYGRTIYKSIQKFIKFQLGINISAVFISAILPFFGIEEPLTVTQILWVNLVMDTLGALAFGGEPALPEYLNEPPKKRDQSILDKTSVADLFASFVYTGIFTIMLALSMINKVDITTSRTMIFTYFILSSVISAFRIRDDIHPLNNLSQNKMFIWIMGLIVIIQIFMAQFGGEVMGCHGLNLNNYLTIFIPLAIIIIGNVITAFLGSKIKK